MREYDSVRLKESLSSTALWVEQELDQIFANKKSISRLPLFAGYSLGSSGKRIRPFLVRAACCATGGSPDRALYAACAVEMIHTYSLIHDDLPAMDNDDLRRGKPTLHKTCGENQALLAGDLLLIEAFGVLLRTPLGPGRVAGMVRHLASAAGPGYLVGGQYMDMYHPAEADMDWIRLMIKGKSAALIRVSLELGALAGGADDELINEVSIEGDRLGYLFQLTDDILDIRGSTAEMGKKVSKDSDLGKCNPVTKLGLDAAVSEAEELSYDIAVAFSGLRGNWGEISSLALYLPDRRK